MVYFGIDEVNFLLALVDAQIELDRNFNHSERFIDLQILRSKVDRL